MTRPVVPANGDTSWGTPLRNAVYDVSDRIDALITGGSGTKADLVSGFLSIAQLPPGTRLTIIRDPLAGNWKYNGITATGRPGGRNDLCLDFIGGSEASRPAWGNQPGDAQKVTETA